MRVAVLSRPGIVASVLYVQPTPARSYHQRTKTLSGLRRLSARRARRQSFMQAMGEREQSSLGLAQQVSTRVAFFIAGFSTGSWAPLVPYVRSRADLNEAQLGLLLLCLGLGSILTMPLSGALAARYGCRAIITVTSLVLAACLPLLAVFASVPLLALTLFAFGASLGTADVTMNIQATIVERASKRTMMSGFHGLYSVGGLVGSALITGLLGASLLPIVAILVSTVAILLLLARFSRDLLPYGIESQGQHFVFPRGKVLLIGILCFIVFMSEGSMLDWGAIFLTSMRGMEKSQAGLGYTAFAIAMTLGRLKGDQVVTALGGKTILLVGGLCASLGLSLVVLVPSVPVALLGFTLVGLGCSNIVPVLFTQTGRQKIMPAGLAIAAITTIGYTGILTGPAAIGFIAHATTLSVSLALVAFCLLAVPFAAQTVMSKE